LTLRKIAADAAAVAVAMRRGEFETLDDVAEIAVAERFKTVTAQEFRQQKVLHIELMFLKKKE